MGFGDEQCLRRLMLALLSCYYANGVFASRHTERATYRGMSWNSPSTPAFHRAG